MERHQTRYASRQFLPVLVARCYNARCPGTVLPFRCPRQSTTKHGHSSPSAFRNSISNIMPWQEGRRTMTSAGLNLPGSGTNRFCLQISSPLIVKPIGVRGNASDGGRAGLVRSQRVLPHPHASLCPYCFLHGGSLRRKRASAAQLQLTYYCYVQALFIPQSPSTYLSRRCI